MKATYYNLVRMFEPSPNRHTTVKFIESKGGEWATNFQFNEIFTHIDTIISSVANEPYETKKMAYEYCDNWIFDNILAINRASNFGGLRSTFIDEFTYHINEINKLYNNQDECDLEDFFTERNKYFDTSISTIDYEELLLNLNDYRLELLDMDEKAIVKMWDDYNEPLSSVYNKLQNYRDKIEDLLGHVGVTEFWINKIRRESDVIHTKGMYISESQLCILRKHISQNPIKKGRGSTGGKRQAEIIASLHHAKIINLSSKSISLAQVLEYLKPKINELASYKVIAEHFKVNSKDDIVVKELEKAAF